MQDINLLPIEKAKGKLSFLDNRLKIILAATGGISILIIIASIVISALASSYNDDIDSMNKDIKKYSVVDQTKKELLLERERKNNLTMILQKATAMNMDMTSVLDKVANITPDSVSAIKFALLKDDNFSIEGISKDNDSIAYFVYKLNHTGIFKSVFVDKIDYNLDKKNYDFTLKLSLKK